MSVPGHLVSLVRERAKRACEYCGVTEMDVGGPLTVDHFQPRSRSGRTDQENLIYACHACNGYKRAYFSLDLSAPLWNPRTEPRLNHLKDSDDGTVVGSSSVGQTTIDVLRLNRPPLVERRRNRLRQARQDELLRKLGDLLDEMEGEYERIVAAEERRSELLAKVREIRRQMEHPDGT